MNYATITNDTETNITGRVLRAASGIGIATVALTGYWSHPWVLFALFAVSIYLTSSAIVGKGLADLFFKSSTSDIGNVSASERAGRSVTAGVTMGTVISGALMLNPVDMFVLLLVGMYTGMSALIGWDPVRALFGGSSKSTDKGLTRPIPATIGQTGLGGTGHLDEPHAA